jgi:hypothetical protein
LDGHYVENHWQVRWCKWCLSYLNTPWKKGTCFFVNTWWSHGDTVPTSILESSAGEIIWITIVLPRQNASTLEFKWFGLFVSLYENWSEHSMNEWILYYLSIIVNLQDHCFFTQQRGEVVGWEDNDCSSGELGIDPCYLL